MKQAIDGRDQLLCEFRFLIHINDYAKLTVSTILRQDDVITGLCYSIELCETEHIIVVHETLYEMYDPIIIVKALVQKMNKYDLKNLYLCHHCMDTLLKKDESCCSSCEISKITYCEMCSICQDDDHLTVVSVWSTLECGHIFHKDCVLQIKHHREMRFKCPLYRHDPSFSAIKVI